MSRRCAHEDPNTTIQSPGSSCLKRTTATLHGRTRLETRRFRSRGKRWASTQAISTTFGGLFFTAALLIVGAIGITVLEIAAHIIAAIAAPADAMTPIDERDRYVAAKAKGFAFLVLSAVVFITIAGLLLGVTSWSACQALVLAFVVGELVRYGAEIVYYRYGCLK